MISSQISIEPGCIINSALEIISPKWNGNIILEFITEGSSLSFSEIAARIPEISPRMLSMRLKLLVDKKVLVVIPNPDKPKKIRYNLTKPGMKLAFILKEIRDWGVEFLNCENERCCKNECRHGIAITKLISMYKKEEEG